MFTLIGGYQQRTDQAGDDYELEDQDFTILDMFSIERDDLLVKGQTELEPITPMDLTDSLDLNKETTENDNEK